MFICFATFCLRFQARHNWFQEQSRLFRRTGDVIGGIFRVYIRLIETNYVHEYSPNTKKEQKYFLLFTLTLSDQPIAVNIWRLGRVLEWRRSHYSRRRSALSSTSVDWEDAAGCNGGDDWSKSRQSARLSRCHW